MNELLGLYHAEGTSEWQKRAILGDLYFTCDFLLKQYGPPSTPGAGSVMMVYKAIVEKLCKSLECSVNVLPQKLEDYWGRVMGDHGRTIDLQGPERVQGKLRDVAVYLTTLTAERYRLEFRSGQFFMRDRSAKWIRKWDDMPNPRWIIANSDEIGFEWGSKEKNSQGALVSLAPMFLEGYAGFALTMGREFYMAPHKGCFIAENFFHSSYTGGSTVLCTGSLSISNGVVVGVNNDSGHYRPTIGHLVNVAKTLQMLGANVRPVAFTASYYSLPQRMQDYLRKKGREGHSLVLSGEQLLTFHGGEAGLQDMMLNNAKLHEGLEDWAWKRRQRMNASW